MDYALPEVFCWSRFGTEAGEPLDRILSRKEEERRRTGGKFFWGIGNSVGPGIAELVRVCREPEVLFSPIRGRPRPVDVAPGAIVRWRAAEGIDGSRIELPESICVTSRARAVDRAAVHYALVCATDKRLRISEYGRLRFGELRNLRSGRRLGSSQVTAVVNRIAAEQSPEQPEYVVALRARLVDPYFVRLREPELIVIEHTERSRAA